MPTPTSPVIVIDPGHGGIRPLGGSSWNNAVSFSGVLEKNMTLAMAFLLRDALHTLDPAVKVVLTRECDMNLGLYARAAVARTYHADRFLSIHFNGFNKKARGVETFVRPAADGNINYDADRAFASLIQAAAFNAIKTLDPATINRGVKEMALGVLSDSCLGVPTCRACLVELEFIDVEAVDRLFNTAPTAPAARASIARSLAAAILADLTWGRST
jgi:N-acetylmuramoyl-L-alanine amidase